MWDLACDYMLWSAQFADSGGSGGGASFLTKDVELCSLEHQTGAMGARDLGNLQMVVQEGTSKDPCVKGG